MSQIIPFAEQQERMDKLVERFAGAQARAEAKTTSGSFKKAAPEAQAKVLSAASLLLVVKTPLEAAVQSLKQLQAPSADSGAFAEVLAEVEDAMLEQAGVKKESLLLFVAQVNTRIIPMMESLVEEAEQLLA